MAFDPDRLDARDPGFIARVLPLFRAVARHYLSLRHDGLEHLGPGPALLVANHNGGISGPDLVCTLSMLWDRLGTSAPLYALAHDFAMRQLPPLGRPLQKVGAVRACPDNALRVLAAGGQALVYPGGDIEAYRHSRRRDEIVFGQRSGFVRVAQQAAAPIIPIVAHGAHRSAYIFDEGAWIARAMGLPRWGRLQLFPLALALPWGLAVGPWAPYLPLPFPIRLRVLAPIRPAASDDPSEVRDEVRARMQRTLDELAREAGTR